MRPRRHPAALVLLAALALAGCRPVGPNYKAPPVPAPPSFSDEGHNGDWAAAKPADAADRGAWWAIYQDPGLNTLEQHCVSANQNIAAALHAYEQAHDLVRETHASLYPTVSIGGSATRNAIAGNAPQVGPATQRDFWAFLIPLNISWEPDFWAPFAARSSPPRPARSPPPPTSPARASACKVCSPSPTSNCAALIYRPSCCVPQ